MDGIVAGVVSGAASGVLSNLLVHWLQIGAHSKRERRDSLRRGIKAIDDLHQWTFEYAGKLLNTPNPSMEKFPFVVLREIVIMDFERLDDALDKLITAHNRFTSFIHNDRKINGGDVQAHGREGDAFTVAIAEFTGALKAEARRKEKRWWAPWQLSLASFSEKAGTGL